MTTPQIGKVALVTGASSGIGHAVALRLADLGYTVYAAARRLARMESLKEKGIRPISLDLTDESSIEACIAQIHAESGGIDVLVNNAGYGSYGAIEEVPMSEARRQFEVNVFGLARLTQLVLPHMRSKRWGKIINVSSIGGLAAGPYGGWYHATKFAVEALSQSLRQEVNPFDVDVVVIRPGAIRTEWGDIAANNVSAISGNGPYAAGVNALLKAFRNLTAAKAVSADPVVIADLVEKAVTASRPRHAYMAPFSAKWMVLLARVATMLGMSDQLQRVAFGLPKKM